MVCFKENLKSTFKEWKYGRTFYGTDFNEIEDLVKDLKLETLANIGIDGLMYPLSKEINSLNAEDFKMYLDYHFATCEVPSIIGHSMHGLYFGKKI